jgi:hypothetical protein
MLETGSGRAARVEFSYSREPGELAPTRLNYWLKSALARAYFPLLRRM